LSTFFPAFSTGPFPSLVIPERFVDAISGFRASPFS
jgi:hypothetical protein